MSTGKSFVKRCALIFSRVVSSLLSRAPRELTESSTGERCSVKFSKKLGAHKPAVPCLGFLHLKVTTTLGGHVRARALVARSPNNTTTCCTS